MIADLPFMHNQAYAETAFSKMREMGLPSLQQELDQYWELDKWEPLPEGIFCPASNVLTLATGFEKMQKTAWRNFRKSVFDTEIPKKDYTIGKMLGSPKFKEDAVSFDAFIGRFTEDAVNGLPNASLSAKGFWRTFACLVLPELALFRWPGSDYVTFSNKGRNYYQRARAQYLFLGEDTGFTTSFVNGVFERPAVFHDREFVEKVKRFCIGKGLDDDNAKLFLRLLGCRLAVCDLHEMPEAELMAVFEKTLNGPRLAKE